MYNSSFKKITVIFQFVVTFGFTILKFYDSIKTFESSLVILVFGKLRQEDYKFKTSLDYAVNEFLGQLGLQSEILAQTKFLCSKGTVTTNVIEIKSIIREYHE